MRVKLGLVAAVAAAGIWGCGGGSPGSGDINSTDAGSPDSGNTTPDAGADAGVDAGIDAGTDGGPCTGTQPCVVPDAGADAGPDAGIDAGTDAGVDAGTDGGVITINDSTGWTFLEAKDGLASDEVMGASVDQGGNLWVAGGTSGVFLLRKGSTNFEQFGLVDGLHPFGYMADGSPSDLNPYLEAISVAGGPPGTAFIGYMGKPPPAGEQACEDNWDDKDVTKQDPAIYKSGDADKVVLTDTGIDVIHYDIFSGPNVVRPEPRGREKLCNIFRVVYDPVPNHDGKHSVWFGANHGFAWGHAEFAGNPTCDGEYPGVQTTLNCAGVWEHFHPAINAVNGSALLTGDYRGVALDPVNKHDVWFGGVIRTTRYKFGTDFEDFYQAGVDSEGDKSNILDIWPDQVPDFPTKAQRVDDNVSAIAADPTDGSIYVASFDFGIRHLANDGSLIGDVGNLQSPHIFALTLDPEDHSLWVGYGGFGDGVSQIMPDGTVRNYHANVIGDAAMMAVHDIQIDTTTKTLGQNVKHNRVIISFEGGVVGIHQTVDPTTTP
jgi:hypothetical protein